MSEALETLKYFKSAYNSFLKTTNDMFCQITISREQAKEFVEEVEAVEKKVKALVVIKEKNVSVCGFRNRVFGYHSNMTINDTYEYYLNYFGCYHNGFDVELLTKEEFNLLKEVLE